MKDKSTDDNDNTKMGFFKDSEGNTVVWQAPNIPLYGWLIIKILTMVVSAGRTYNGLSQLSTTLLFTWAYLEITSGVNYFRKLLGLVVLVVIIVGFFK